MSFNGSGTFNINTAGQPVVTGTVISSSVFNALTADLATGLSTCITKDGQTTVTANIPMNSFKFTGLAAGTAATDSVRLGQLQAGAATLITVTGTNTYAGTMTPALSAYAAGNTFSFLVPNTNTTSCTLNIDGLGAKSITRDGTTALVAGDLVANSEVVVVYDGTQFQVLNSNSKTNFNLSGTLTVAGNTTLSGGTANGVAYLNGSKVLTTGSALTFDGTNLSSSVVTATSWMYVTPAVGTNNALYRASNTGGTVYLGLDNSAGGLSGAAYALSLYHTGNYPIVFSLNSAEQMRLTSTGLGIGTSSPSQKLNVATASGNAYMRVERASQTTGQVGLQIGGGTSGTDWLLYQPTSSNDFRLFGNSADRVVVTSAGNVTINAPASGTALTVTGAVSATGDAASVCYYVAAAGAIRWNGSSDAYLDYANSPGKLNIRSAAGTNTVAVFDASGNLGLGVTPSAWSQGKAFELRDVGFGIWNGTQSIYSIANAYFNGGFKYANTGVQASHYYQYQGQHVWSTAPSGTAGTAITFTQAMTLDSSGNLLVGTTSNVGSARVAVTFAGPSNDGVDILDSANGSGSQFMAFRNSAGTAIGSITRVTTTNAVSYNTTSDQRLKENITDADSASDLIDAIKVRQFDWKADGTHQRYGMIAQELYEAAPEAVHVPADPEDMMSVDYSKLVPMLIKEIQSLRQRVAQLEEK